jgi:hypothetical protein
MLKRISTLALAATTAAVGLQITGHYWGQSGHDLIAPAEARGGGGGRGGYGGDRALSSVDVAGVARRTARDVCPGWSDHYIYGC